MINEGNVPAPESSAKTAAADTASQEQVPVIDVSSLFTPGADTSATVAAIHAALQNIGFMYVVGHNIEEGLVARMFAYAERFFALPRAVKDTIAMSRAGLAWRGFFPLGGELTSGRPDQKEGLYMGLEHDDAHRGVVEKWPTFGKNQWLADEGAHGVAGFRDTYIEYIDKLVRLAHTLLGAIARALTLPEDYFRARFTADPTVLFRIFNYPKQDLESARANDEWGVREHTDYGFLTILKQDDCGGLEVKTRTGEWVPAPPVPESFVINIGDMLELWTHGLYRATPHRVRNAAARDRLSMPFFFDPGWDCTLEPIAQSVLPPVDARLIQADSAINRWDGLELSKLSEQTTYGAHLFTKLQRVFPELAGVARPEGDAKYVMM